MLRIVEETRFARSKIYRLIATVEADFPWCGGGQLYAELICTDRERPALKFLRPFYWKKIVLIEFYGRRLRVTSESWAFVKEATKNILNNFMSLVNSEILK